MEIKSLINAATRLKNIIAITLLLGFVSGLAVNYLYPLTYFAEGSILVRNSQLEEVSSEEVTILYDYKYDGFYSMQSSQAQTENYIGILESKDVAAEVLMSTDKEITAASLRNFKRAIKVKKNSPQIVSLTIKDKSKDEVQTLWKKTIEISSQLASSLNEGDTNETVIIPFREDAVISESYRNPYIFGLSGLLFGLLCSAILVTFYSYLSPTK